MSKKINRTIIHTTANVTIVNTEDQTFTERPVTLKGNFDEASMLKELNKGKALDEFYCKVTDLDHESLYFTMTDADFVKFGTAGLKPTTRERFVTTHIKSTVATIMVVNKEDKVEKIDIEVTGLSKAKIRKSVEDLGYIFVKEVKRESDEAPYWMYEDDFIAHATATQV